MNSKFFCASLLCGLLVIASPARSQFLMDMIDTTTDMGKSVLSVSKKFDRIRIGGYIQSQFQLATAKGISSFSGGDFAQNSDNRFMLRRGRIRFDYAHFPEKGASFQFVFQFDGTERGVFIRDFYGRVLENRWKLFGLSAGMFARPFSYELNLSSSDRESPERGRMSQILMKTERDMGAMLSFEPRARNHPLRYLKIDLGLFNGQGLAAPGDYDSHKDFIARISTKPYQFSKNIFVSSGFSLLQGGLLRNTRHRFLMDENAKTFRVDSSEINMGKIAPRKYYGADAQLKFKTRAGLTELRAEYMAGKQTAFANSTETPAALPVDPHVGFYERNFDGAYFYLLHNILSSHHQAIIKFDWYDPNKKVKGKEIGAPGTNLRAADIKYSTLGFGYCHYFKESVKVVLYYDRVFNESVSLPGFTNDVKDDVITLRIQFRF